MEPVGLFAGGAALLLAAAWAAIARPLRRQRRIQDGLVAAARATGQPCWRVRVAREAYLKRRLRLHAAQAHGVLIDEGDSLRLRGQWAAGHDDFDIVVSKGAADVAWVGPIGPQRQRDWARLRTPIGELVFSVDTGWRARDARRAQFELFRSALPALATGPGDLQDHQASGAGATPSGGAIGYPVPVPADATRCGASAPPAARRAPDESR